jgi:hypothetical protein
VKDYNITFVATLFASALILTLLNPKAPWDAGF